MSVRELIYPLPAWAPVFKSVPVTALKWRSRSGLHGLPGHPAPRLAHAVGGDTAPLAPALARELLQPLAPATSAGAKNGLNLPLPLPLPQVTWPFTLDSPWPFWFS